MPFPQFEKIVLMGNVPLVIKYNKITKPQETKMKYLKFPT